MEGGPIGTVLVYLLGLGFCIR